MVDLDSSNNNSNNVNNNGTSSVHNVVNKKKTNKPLIGWFTKKLSRRSSTNNHLSYELDDNSQTFKQKSNDSSNHNKRRSTLNGVLQHRRSNDNSWSTLKTNVNQFNNNGADEDASIKPLNSNKSLTFTNSSSEHSFNTSNSNDMESKTFTSNKTYASTKPTTLLSLDGYSIDAQQPLAHIAQAHSSPSFLSLNSPSPSQNNNQSQQQQYSNINNNTQFNISNNPYIHPPTYSRPQLQNNPRPLSPPNDDASILTLASSNAGRVQSQQYYNQNNYNNNNDNLSSVRKSSIHSSLKLNNMDDDDFSTKALAPNSRRASYDSNFSTNHPSSVRSFNNNNNNSNNNHGNSPLNPIRIPDNHVLLNNNYKRSTTTIATTAASFRTASERQSVESVPTSNSAI